MKTVIAAAVSAAIAMTSVTPAHALPGETKREIKQDVRQAKREIKRDVRKAKRRVKINQVNIRGFNNNVVVVGGVRRPAWYTHPILTAVGIGIIVAATGELLDDDGNEIRVIGEGDDILKVIQDDGITYLVMD